MANTLLTIDMITRKALEILENELVLTRQCFRGYDKDYGVAGAKIGNTLRIRLPARYTVADGAALQTQAFTETFVSLPVINQKHIGVAFGLAEQTLSLDDYSERVMRPAMSQLASEIDADVFNTVYSQAYQAVGTPGTTPSTNLVILQAGQKLNEAAAPIRDRHGIVDPAAQTNLVNGMTGLFNPTQLISGQFRSGMLGTNLLGFDTVEMSQSVANHLTGSRSGAITVTTAVSQGATTINLTGTGSQTVTKGDIFTIAGIFSVNPQTRKSTGALQQFTVVATNQASAGVYSNVQISPAIYSAGQQQATVTSLPVGGESVVFMGGASTLYPQNLFFTKNAIAFATAELDLPSDGVKAARATYKGISLTVTKQFNIINYQDICRIDIVYGALMQRPQEAVRMWG